MANWFTSWFKGKAAEGEYRPGPYALQGGWLSATAGSFWNWWQLGYSLQPYSTQSAMVEACVSAYSQTVAMCPGDHWETLPTGGRKRVASSALSRIMRRPNDYQSTSDFLMNLTRRLYMNGNAYALAIRNNRGEISELHLMCEGFPRIAETGDIFYDLSGNEIIERRINLSYPVPARDVLHVRLTTPRHPLKGESPIMAAALDLATRSAMIQQQLTFFGNQAKPSIMLRTDEKLTRQQVDELREMWDSQTRGDAAGGTPIMTWGLKAETITPTSEDSQLAELLKMTDQNVALAFRVPLQILGMGGTPFASTELLMQSWVASGLGFALNHIEQAFDSLFRLSGFPVEYLELDTRALLRSAYKERIAALAQGVIGGIYSPDEARAEEGLPPAPGGHGKEPRVQQQVVPLSYGSEMKPPDPNPPKPEPDDSGDDKEPETSDDDTKEFERVRAFDDYWRFRGELSGYRRSLH